MDISQLSDSPGRTRVSALGALGTALMAAGLGAAFAIATSGFGRYMHLESLRLGLDESTMQAVTEASPMDTSVFVLGLVLATLGFVALLIAGRKPGRGRRPRPAA